MHKDDKRELREQKRLLKQLGNQQARQRARNALKSFVDGETDDIGEADMDESLRSKYLNGFDKKKKDIDYV